MGHSLTHLEGMPKDDGLAFALAGALFASVALFVGFLLRPATSQLENSRPSIYFLGLKIGVVGFFIALCGWLMTIYICGKSGLVLVAVGVLVGFVGMLIHFFFLFFGGKNA